MGISIYIEGDYEEFHALRRRKNKANSKPNKTNSPAFGLVHRGKTIPIPIQDNRDEAATRPPLAGNPRQDESSRMTEHNLKKQSQFISYCVLRDAYCEKEFEKTKPICERAKWR